jgi:glycosyltransferase involved in cell wall biosynthesis
VVSAPRVALVHDWLTGMRGGERCLEVLCELYPDAPLFTLVHVPGSVSPVVEDRQIITSRLQRLPIGPQKYSKSASLGPLRYLLPMFPWAIEGLDLRGYDLVISMSHCVAKGAPVSAGALHLCYCFSPMRYVWDMYEEYVGRREVKRLLTDRLAKRLREWDSRTSSVDDFVAISNYIADRIQRTYNRSADVIYPPVDVARFEIADATDDYYLIVSALVPYKRIDLAVAAATRLERNLLVVGTGPEEKRLRKMAGPTVSFFGWRSDAEVARLYARCRALVFPAVEDFGIAPLEAAAAGRPTIALGRGGARETMVGLDEGDAAPTALFFNEQSVEAVEDAILKFERVRDRFDPKALRARAEQFDRPLFKQRLRHWIDRRWSEHQTRRAC